MAAGSKELLLPTCSECGKYSGIRAPTVLLRLRSDQLDAIIRQRRDPHVYRGAPEPDAYFKDRVPYVVAMVDSTTDRES